MKWIKLTTSTFKDLENAHHSGKGIVIAKPHTEYAGALYWSYHIYHTSPELLNYMIKSNNYYYMILDEPNFK